MHSAAIMDAVGAQPLEAILAMTMVHGTSHWAGWNRTGHYSARGQSCPCCRWTHGEILGTCDICEDYWAVKCVSKDWHAAARHIRCNNGNHVKIVYKILELPSHILVDILLNVLGHKNTRNRKWHPSHHYRDGNCFRGCMCCTSLHTNRLGCQACKAYVMVKRASFRLCSLAEDSKTL